MMAFKRFYRKIQGELMYVNYGRIEDFSWLTEEKSMNLTGKICVARYGKIFRGDKVGSVVFYHGTLLLVFLHMYIPAKDSMIPYCTVHSFLVLFLFLMSKNVLLLASIFGCLETCMTTTP